MKGFYEIRRVVTADDPQPVWQLWRYHKLTFREWFGGARGGFKFVCQKPTEAGIRKEMDVLCRQNLRKSGETRILNADRYRLTGEDIFGGWAG